jgi:hypothetical protein
MIKYSYLERGSDGNPITITKTEQEILKDYWPYWSSKMKELNRGPITRERCLEDWIVVNWAWRI